ncbi:MAG: hypothetical protein ABSE21_12230 [Bryobacteraceae bacterium]|jgi:hypothetical protein
MFLRIGLVSMALSACLAAQGIVEHSLGVATGAAAAGAAQRLGKTVGEKIEKISETLPTPPPRTLKPLTAIVPGASRASTAASSASATRATPPAAAGGATPALVPSTPASASPSAPAISYEDPAGIQEGMDYAQLLQRFGPPSMKYSSTAGEQTLCYTRPDHSLDVQLRDGKVAAIRRSGESSDTVILR